MSLTLSCVEKLHSVLAKTQTSNAFPAAAWQNGAVFILSATACSFERIVLSCAQCSLLFNSCALELFLRLHSNQCTGARLSQHIYSCSRRSAVVRLPKSLTHWTRQLAHEALSLTSASLRAALHLVSCFAVVVVAVEFWSKFVIYLKIWNNLVVIVCKLNRLNVPQLQQKQLQINVNFMQPSKRSSRI